MIDEGAYGIVWKAINKDTGNIGIIVRYWCSCDQGVQGRR